jgi:hypothetical protein
MEASFDWLVTGNGEVGQRMIWADEHSALTDDDHRKGEVRKRTQDTYSEIDQKFVDVCSGKPKVISGKGSEFKSPIGEERTV